MTMTGFTHDSFVEVKLWPSMRFARECVGVARYTMFFFLKPFVAQAML